MDVHYPIRIPLLKLVFKWSASTVTKDLNSRGAEKKTQRELFVYLYLREPKQV